MNVIGYRAQTNVGDLMIVVESTVSTCHRFDAKKTRGGVGWCKTKEISENPKKIEVVLFTGKRETDGVISLTYEGEKLNPTKKVKY